MGKCVHVQRYWRRLLRGVLSVYSNNFIPTLRISVTTPARCRFDPFLFLDKLNLGKHHRTFAVYAAGGPESPAFLLASLTSTSPKFSLVRNLDVPRCRNPLRTRAPTTQRAELPAACARQCSPYRQASCAEMWRVVFRLMCSV